MAIWTAATVRCTPACYDGSVTSAPGWSLHPRVVSARRRAGIVDLLVETVIGFQRHRTGRSAALLAHYGFLSVFPLLLVFTTIVGFVLDGRPDLQADVIDSVFARIPIIGPQLESDPAALRGSGFALVVGLLIALWAGLRAFAAAHTAIDDAWDVDDDTRRGWAGVRLRALAMVAVIGTAQVGAAVATGFVGVGGIDTSGRLALVGGGLVLNGGVLAASYFVLSSVPLGFRDVRRATVLGAIAFTGLQLLGTVVVARAIANATPVYGTFATVIGLLTWMSLHALIALGGAELDAAAHRMANRPDDDVHSGVAGSTDDDTDG
jgi:membrane protein